MTTVLNNLICKKQCLLATCVNKHTSIRYACPFEDKVRSFENHLNKKKGQLDSLFTTVTVVKLRNHNFG